MNSISCLVDYIIHVVFLLDSLSFLAKRGAKTHNRELTMQKNRQKINGNDYYNYEWKIELMLILVRSLALNGRWQKGGQFHAKLT